MADNRFSHYNAQFIAKLFHNALSKRKTEINKEDVREAITQVPGYFEDFRAIMEPIIKRRMTLDEMVIAVCLDLEAHPVKVRNGNTVEDLDGYDIQKTNHRLIMFTQPS